MPHPLLLGTFLRSHMVLVKVVLNVEPLGAAGEGRRGSEERRGPGQGEVPGRGQRSGKGWDTDPDERN